MINKNVLHDFRCLKDNKLLCKVFDSSFIQIKCPRCGSINEGTLKQCFIISESDIRKRNEYVNFQEISLTKFSSVVDDMCKVSAKFIDEAVLEMLHSHGITGCLHNANEIKKQLDDNGYELKVEIMPKINDPFSSDINYCLYKGETQIDIVRANLIK